MNSCYKCGSSDELSIKSRRRYGNPMYICRGCRRDYYHNSKKQQSMDEVDRSESDLLDWITEWTQQANMINDKLIKKYVTPRSYK